MISGLRGHVLALACVRHGLPAVHGRGIDRLPCVITATLEASLVGQLDSTELLRAFRILIKALLSEIQLVDPQLAGRLHNALIQLTEILPVPSGDGISPV